jgi:hypothetical protein
MNKIITINPDLFKHSSNRGSRKKKPAGTNDIRVKTPKEKRRSIRKNHVLKFIRDQQEKNLKQLLETDKSTKTAETLSTDFNSDFNESLNYLMSLSEEKEKGKKGTPTNNNNTLKNYSLPKSNVNFNVIDSGGPNIIDTFVSSPAVPIFPSQLSVPNLQAVPKYGCLKGGTLPTYRSYHNQTQKKYAETHQSSSQVTSSSEKKPEDFDKDIYKKSEIRQTLEKIREKPKKMRFPKQKRTVRRTFKVGKSKTKPHISVLVSNKTIRNQITTKTHLLKQTPIDEVRRYLTKKGFIRVGSDAPNDVLRKMYESAVLICGEIQNHNPDNLLYNFLNDVKP